MHRRAGRWALTTTRRERRDFIRRNWLLIVRMTAVWGAVSVFCVLILQLANGRVLVPFAVGGFAVSYVWLMATALNAVDGTYLRRLGGEAERHVSDDLRRLRRRGWRIVDHVTFKGRDVDHVLIGPGGVWAVETKRSMVEMRLTPSGIEGLYSGDPTQQARRAAKDIRMLLRSDIPDLEVHAAVVLAGPGAPNLPAGRQLIRNEYGDVLVLTLRDLHRNLDAFDNGERLSSETVASLASTVDGFVERRDAYDRRTVVSTK